MPQNILTTIWSGIIAAQSAPVDGTTVPQPDVLPPDANGLRCRSAVIEIDATVTSGTGAATIDLYLWDGSRWSKSDASINIAISQTASGPQSRRVYEVPTIAPYVGLLPVVSVINGTGASLSCRVADRG